MFKHLKASLLLTLLLITTYPCFSSVYIGASIGLAPHSYSSQMNSDVSPTIGLQTNSYLPANETDFAGSVFLGYRHIWNPYFFDLQLSSTFGKHSIYLSPSTEDPRFIAQDFLSESTKIKINSPEFDIDWHPGFFISPSTLLYGIVGIAFNEFSVATDIVTNSSTESGRGRFANSIDRLNWRFGLGIEKILSTNVTLFFNYIFTDYGHINAGGSTICIPPATCSFSNFSKSTAQNQLFLLGFTYQLFGNSKPSRLPKAETTQFNGLFIGVNGGLTSFFLKNEITLLADTQGTAAIPILSRFNVGPHASSGIANLFLGYAHLWSTAYLAEEVGLGYSRQLAQASIVAMDSSNGEVLTGTFQSRLGPFLFHLDLKPGLMLPENTLIYARLGLALTQLKMINNVIADDTTAPDISHGEIFATHRSIKAGLRVGLGIEEMVSDNISVHAEYLFTYYGSASDTSSAPIAVTTPPATTMDLLTKLNNLYSHSIQLGVSYHFG